MTIKLNPFLESKWFHNLTIFLIPLVLVYITQVIGTLNIDGHVFSVYDLVPTRFTVGAGVLYIFNGIYDYLRKLLENQRI